VIVVQRFDVSGDDHGFAAEAEQLLDVLAQRPGFVRGRLARGTDEPGSWVLTTEWQGVGAYRRALSAYDVKVLAPFLGRARPEPSAFEIVARRDESRPLAANPSDRARQGS
jgi:heme oxygenase (mycobilin-producing)